VGRRNRHISRGPLQQQQTHVAQLGVGGEIQMGFRKLAFFVLSLGPLICATSSQAQPRNSGSIEGVVKDPSGGVVAGATVEISYAFHGDHYKWSLRFMVINLTNKTALYNFLSTFSGTHFVTPRSYTAELGFYF